MGRNFSWKGTLGGVLGVVIAISGILFGLYAGLWVMFVGGIVQMVEAFKVTPINSMDVAIGVVRIVFAAPVGWACFVISLIFGKALFG